MGNRARDLPAFGAVPQSAARPDPLPSIINTVDIRNFIYFFLKQTALPLRTTTVHNRISHKELAALQFLLYTYPTRILKPFKYNYELKYVKE
jgi:hypothetical protein